MNTNVTVSESVGTLTPGAGRKWRARIIEGDRWGSSGFYPAEVLERDGPTTWPAGTHVFFDHPGETERHDRPERSVRDIAGTLTSAPVYENGGLHADITFTSWAAPIVAELADSIGLSIRASGSMESGERQGRTGPVITALREGLSVDLVTHAGCGGRLISLLESARRDEPAGDTSTPVHEIAHSTPNGLTTPLHENAQSTPEPPSTTPPQEATMEINEARLRALETAEVTLTALQPEHDRILQENGTLNAALNAARTALAVERAARIVAEADTAFTALETKGLMVDLPFTEAGELDTPAFAARVEEAATEKQTATPHVTGFGATTVTESRTPSLEDLDKATAGAFGRTVN